MEIRTVEIRNLYAGTLKQACEGERHIKALPCLSVVQSLCGVYEIGLGGALPERTDEGGAFVAPSGVMQEIVHHNGRGGYMEAQWVFMNITVNDFFEYEDIFIPPVLVSAKYGAELSESIYTIRTDANVCRRYSAAYRIADLLFSLSAPNDVRLDPTALLLKRYVEQHYRERITKEELAAAAHCSTAGMYRIFQRRFGMSPNNYINKVRLGKAAVLLESGDTPVKVISGMVGFDDPVYFSKLFKEYSGVSPKGYRRFYSKQSEGGETESFR